MCRHMRYAMADDFFAHLAETMPCFITRKDIAKYLGSYISVGYLANLDSERKGPDRRRIGRKVVYERSAFIDWLKSRTTKEVI